MTEVFEDYLTLARGGYLEQQDRPLTAIADEFPSSWWDYRRELKELDKRGLRQRVMKGCVPKPSHIENLVYCSELRRWHGNLSEVAGFDKKGNFILPSGYGVLYPVREGREIVRLAFMTFAQLMRPKAKAA